MTKELEQKCAEAILTAAGSGLRQYTPQSQDRILKAAKEFLESAFAEAFKATHTSTLKR